MFECFAHMYVCNMCVLGACRGQKKMWDPLGLATDG